MVFQQCPVCQHVNDELALRCAACHSDLRDADTVPAALITMPVPQAAAGALWLDDLASPRPPAPAPLEPPPPVLTLRDVVAPKLPVTKGTAAAKRAPAPPPLPPALRGAPPTAFPPLAPFPPLPPLPAVAPTPPVGPLTPPLPTPLATELPTLNLPVPEMPVAGQGALAPAGDDPGHAARAAAREARRASVRRARLRQAAAALGDTVPEVLVLDRDGAARDLLCNLLRGFGFGVHSLADVRRAMELRKTRHFAAAFVDIRLDAADGGLGIDLCHQWHEAGDTVLVLVAAPLHPVDRVRAEMLGFAGILAKPVTRGDVARVLDANGVALPSDARRI